VKDTTPHILVLQLNQPQVFSTTTTNSAGHCGDRHSRKTSLVYSLLLMAVPTTLMGCLPTFQHISWAAPVLLILLRLGQGLAIGGENGTALV
jgi:MFS family permease